MREAVACVKKQLLVRVAPACERCSFTLCGRLHLLHTVTLSLIRILLLRTWSCKGEGQGHFEGAMGR